MDINSYTDSTEGTVNINMNLSSLQIYLDTSPLS